MSDDGGALSMSEVILVSDTSISSKKSVIDQQILANSAIPRVSPKRKFKQIAKGDECGSNPANSLIHEQGVNQKLKIGEGEVRGRLKDQGQINKFNEVVDDCDLYDLGHSDYKFTWSRKLANGSLTFERLNRFFASGSWKDLMNQYSVSHLNSPISDHKPILLQLEFMSSQRRLKGNSDKFFFETIWASYEGCEPNIVSSWALGLPGSSLVSTAGKLERTGLNLKAWSKKEIPSIPKELIELQKRLDNYGEAHLLVSALLTEDGAHWNEQVINQYFLPGDRDLILSIPMVKFRKEDQLIWHFSPDGVYSVRSGYRTALQNQSQIQNGGVGASNGGNESMWKRLWGMKIPEKMKIFWWRVLHNILPTNDNLLKKKLLIQPECHRCGEEIESNLHCMDWFDFLHQNLCKEELIFVSYIMWHIWYSRNVGVFQSRWKSEAEVLLECNNSWRNWKKVSPLHASTPSPTSGTGAAVNQRNPTIPNDAIR
ncbi:hypothetical protein RIF29_25396 [Crotalaria pallida]|uniref:Reverse transcriptase zinc-binding domain-containing protein n=1 Tax=Crotalaria pallida TaxID=3830 RepID=A0AAN9EM30_CROPI